MNYENLRLGGVTLRVESPFEYTSSEKARPFHCAGTKNDYLIRVLSAEKMPIIPHDASTHLFLSRWRDGTGDCFLKRGGERSELFTCAVRSDRVVRLTFAKGYLNRLSTLNILESADLPSILAESGQIILHSSYIITRRGDAVLFSGPSGIGKSTQAALWEKLMGAEIINGDRCLIDARSRTANGIFYSGSSDICKNKSAPLTAIVMLEQSDLNEVSVIRPRRAFEKVLAQSSYYKWDEHSASVMTGLAADLVSSVPVYLLRCRPDAAAVSLLNEVLYGNKKF